MLAKMCLYLSLSGCTAKFPDWNKRSDIKSALKVGLILLLNEHGYPPVERDEVYQDIFEQAENFEKNNFQINGQPFVSIHIAKSLKKSPPLNQNLFLYKTETISSTCSDHVPSLSCTFNCTSYPPVLGKI